MRLSSIRIFRKWTAALLLGLVTVQGQLYADSHPQEQTNVLLLQSYHQGMMWTADIAEAIRNRLTEHNVTLHEEYLDTKRFPLAQVADNAATYLGEKYRDTYFKVIISVDNNALTFLQERKDTLFPDSLIVFCGINNYSDSLIEGLEERITGVVEESDPIETVRLIQMLQPETKRIVVISGSTETAKHIRIESKKEFSKIKELEFDWWDELPLEEVLSRCRQLQPDDAVIVLSLQRDGNGRFISRVECAQLLAKVSSAPVYCFWHIFENSEIIGGVTVRGEDQGSVSSSLATTYLNHGKISPIVKTCPTRAVVSYPALIRYNLDPKKLPDDAVIIDEPVEYMSNTPYYIALLVVLVLSLMFIGAPLAYRFFKKTHVQRALIHEMRTTTMAVLGIAVLSILTVFAVQELSSFQHTISKTRKTLINDRKIQKKYQIDRIVADIAILQQADEPNDHHHGIEAQKNIALQMIAGVPNKFANDYLFVVDMEGFMLFHPDPELHNTDASYLVDITGKKVIQNIISSAQNTEGGFCTYLWPKLKTGGGPAPKITFSRRVDKWNWVIASGVYIDDIEASMIPIQKEMKHKMIRHGAIILLLGMLSLLLLEILFRFIAKRMLSEITDLTIGISEVNPHRLSRDFSIEEFSTIAKGVVATFDTLVEAERDLRSSHANFESFFASASDMIIVCSKSGEILYINKAVINTLKWNRNALIGQALQQIIPEEDIEAILSGRKKQSMSPIRKRDQSFLTVETQFFNGEWNGEPVVFSVCKDISELLLSEQKFATAFQNNVALMIISNLGDGKIIEANKTFLNVMKYNENEVLGQTLPELGLLTLEEQQGFIDTMPESGQSQTIEINFTDCKGNVHIGEYRTQRLEIGDKECLLTVINDITERKSLEGQLVQAQKLESVGQLAAGIAHEINTPIQFVSDNLRFLKDAINDLLELADNHQELITASKEEKVAAGLIDQQEKQLKDADTEYLKEELPLAIDQSLDGTDRVSKLVRAMKEFSHPGSTEMSSANLNDAIQTTIVVAKNEWKYVADIETNFAEDMPMVPCLVSEFNQVILNMIVNARDAIAETEQHGTITISTTYDNTCAIIKISDTGAGMPEAVQQRIFDPFFTTKEVGKGSGQGLAIAHNLIVKKHGGEIDVESEAGKGTTFEIKLPLEQETVANAEAV